MIDFLRQISNFENKSLLDVTKYSVPASYK